MQKATSSSISCGGCRPPISGSGLQVGPSVTTDIESGNNRPPVALIQGIEQCENSSGNDRNGVCNDTKADLLRIYASPYPPNQFPSNFLLPPPASCSGSHPSCGDIVPAIRVNYRGDTWFARVVTLNGGIPQMPHLGDLIQPHENAGDYMLGIESDTEPPNPLLVLKQKGNSSSREPQHLIRGMNKGGSITSVLDAQGHLRLGQPTTNGSLGVMLEVLGGDYNNALRLESPLAPSLYLKNTSVGGGAYAIFSTNNGSGAGGGKLAFYDDGNGGGYRMVIDSSGDVGIGTTSPANALEVGVGKTTLADAWTVRSSRRLKTNIQPLDRALEKVEQLRGVSYDSKDSGRHEIGVVAEEVAQVVPEVVFYNRDTREIEGVDYSRLAAVLIEAVKAQQVEIRKLQEEIARLTLISGAH